MSDTREQFERWWQDTVGSNMETYAEDKNSHWLAWKAATERAGKAPAPAVPEGWRLVPVEPTPKMKKAMRDAADGAYLSKMDGIEGDSSNWALQSYRAMLNAAPQPTGDDR